MRSVEIVMQHRHSVLLGICFWLVLIFFGLRYFLSDWSGQGRKERAADKPSATAVSKNVRWFSFPYKIPNDGVDHYIEVYVEEEDQNRKVYSTTHKAGEKVSAEFELRSTKFKVRLFDNDQLIGKWEESDSFVNQPRVVDTNDSNDSPPTGKLLVDIKKQRLTYRVPDDGNDHQISIDVEEEPETRTVYNQKHKAGDIVTHKVDISSQNHKIFVYDNDMLINVPDFL
jgi:hypothetical protein